MNNRGYTLLEMVLVILIIGILATVAVQSMKTTTENDRFDRTTEEMDAIVRGIVGDDRLVSNGYRTDFGYVGDVGSLPPNLDALAANPGGYSTWKGPYLKSDFVENASSYQRDAWNSAYSYSGGVTIRSTGSGSNITRQFAAAPSDLTANTVTGFVRDVVGAPPGDSAGNVTVTIYYPDGSGGMTSSITTPSRAGEFTFASAVPIGIHRIQAVVSGANDTSSRYLAVYPASIALADLRFPSALWNAGGSGGGGGGGAIILVDGTQTFPGGDCEDIQFDIMNTSGSPITITSLTLTWPSPTAYYRRIRWNNGTVWNNENPRNGSGNPAPLNSPRTLLAGQTATIDVQGFRDQPISGDEINMRNTTFTINFSDGSSIVVAMGNCNN